MKRFLSVFLVAAVVASAAGAPEEAWAAPQAPFSHEAIRHAVAVAAPAAAPPGGAASKAVAASNADTNRSWDTLARTVKAGQKLVVTLMNATSIEGRFRDVNAHSISIEQGAALRVIEVTDIVRIRRAGVRKRHVLYGMLIGAVAGAVGMVAIDQKSSHPSTTTEAAGLGAIVIGLPVGALVGAILPTGPPLYEAPTPVRQTR